MDTFFNFLPRNMHTTAAASEGAATPPVAGSALLRRDTGALATLDLGRERVARQPALGVVDGAGRGAARLGEAGRVAARVRLVVPRVPQSDGPVEQSSILGPIFGVSFVTTAVKPVSLAPPHSHPMGRGGGKSKLLESRKRGLRFVCLPVLTCLAPAGSLVRSRMTSVPVCDLMSTRTQTSLGDAPATALATACPCASAALPLPLTMPVVLAVLLLPAPHWTSPPQCPHCGAFWSAHMAVPATPSSMGVSLVSLHQKRASISTRIACSRGQQR